MQDEMKWIKASLQVKFGLTTKRLETILESYESLEQAWSDGFGKLKEQKNKWLSQIDYNDVRSHSQILYDKCVSEGIEYVSIEDALYPQSLLALHTPPVGFFYKGGLEVLESKFKITIVGSRSVANLSEAMLNSIVKPILSRDIVVVSGLAYGIDTLAHRLSAGLRHPTLAVIGSGLDKSSFYPKENLSLARQIIEDGGLIISEYGPQTPPNKFTFPARNRILAALSNLTLVVQASLKSGTLITAAVARDLGKTVATFPSSPFDKSFAGNLELMKEGANIIVNSQDIVDILGINQMLNNQELTKTFSSPQEALVYKQLDTTPTGVDELQEKLSMNLVELQSHLTMLEISGYVRSTGNNQWLIIR